MRLGDLIVRLRIDDNRNTKNKSSKMVAKVNIVESSNKEEKRKFVGDQQQPKYQKSSQKKLLQMWKTKPYGKTMQAPKEREGTSKLCSRNVGTIWFF